MNSSELQIYHQKRNSFISILIDINLFFHASNLIGEKIMLMLRKINGLPLEKGNFLAGSH